MPKNTIMSAPVLPQYEKVFKNIHTNITSCAKNLVIQCASSGEFESAESRRTEDFKIVTGCTNNKSVTIIWN